jgi:nicotinate-nucleotide adenylyltransferase
MKIGLYFGSFNPNHMAYETDLDKVWFVVSPHNPHKEEKSLLNEHHRLHLVELAIGESTKLKASNIEFSLPRPSYTIDTLTYLEEKFPQDQFVVIMGSDSFQNLPRWKNAERLLERYAFYIYNRPGHPIKESWGASITIVDAPLLEISSSYIRKKIREGKPIQWLVSDPVNQYIQENNYYK